MSQALNQGTANPTPELPSSWRLFLVGENMKVVSLRGAGSRRLEADLADYLLGEGMELAEVGELLACLEDLPAQAEIRLDSEAAEAGSLVARRLSARPSLCCVAVRPRGRRGSEGELKAVWGWGLSQARLMGLLPRRSAGTAAPIVLMIDDNPDVLALGQSLLRKLGCRALAAASGGQALAMAKARAFDFVLVDSQIEGVGLRGLREVLERRSRERWGRAPLIAAMYAEGSEAHPDEGLSKVSKPLAMSELRPLVEEARALLYERAWGEGEGDGPPVMEAGPWGESDVLLARLVRALVAQGEAFKGKVRQSGSFALDDEQLAEVESLRNGCEIVLARRLASACRQVLDEAEQTGAGAELSGVGRLLSEIGNFRQYAARRGLLPAVENE